MKSFGDVKSLVDVKGLGLALAFSVFACLATTSVSFAAPPMAPLPRIAVIQADWQGPLSLPRRFRNHCGIDTFSGRPYCSDHCGFDYQFYYCSPPSFGCCRVGFGYCDWNGLLRCHP
jgi:hypothetical protein